MAESWSWGTIISASCLQPGILTMNSWRRSCRRSWWTQVHFLSHEISCTVGLHFVLLLTDFYWFILGPDFVVCDEGHILRKESSNISKALNGLRTKRRVVLTGTPLQNNLVECKSTLCRVTVTSKSTSEHATTLVWFIANEQVHTRCRAVAFRQRHGCSKTQGSWKEQQLIIGRFDALLR